MRDGANGSQNLNESIIHEREREKKKKSVTQCPVIYGREFKQCSAFKLKILLQPESCKSDWTLFAVCSYTIYLANTHLIISNRIVDNHTAAQYHILRWYQLRENEPHSAVTAYNSYLNLQTMDWLDLLLAWHFEMWGAENIYS